MVYHQFIPWQKFFWGLSTIPTAISLLICSRKLFNMKYKLPSRFLLDQLNTILMHKLIFCLNWFWNQIPGNKSSKEGFLEGGMIPPIVHWQSSSTSIKPNISNCSRCLSQDWLRCGQVLFYVYLQGIVLSQSLIRNPLFYKPCSFQGQRFWILRIFPPPFFSWQLACPSEGR